MGTSGKRRPIRAALYTRVSTRAQADKHGSAYQREALERMAEARGWLVAGVYALCGAAHKANYAESTIMRCDRP